MLFDTHVHLNAEQFNDDVEEVIARAKDAGVERMVVVGFDEKTINRALELVEAYEFLYAAVGWHPVDAIDMTDKHLEWLEELSAHPKVVALGEMGLDYHWDKSPKDIQKEVFIKQIHLAKKVNLPIIIHNREADQDIVDILEAEGAKDVGGIMHCFGGSVEIADRCLAMNFYISLGGPVTFKNAKRPKEVAKHVPIEKLLIETDCPYLAPHPNRGKRNEPGYVKLVAEEIADLRGISYEELAQHTTRNANELFRLTNE
ncbi:TatD family hydrolase [Alkalicoccobacillus murimartini]|uniref:TatD DNase family protein n=1 Tax=Alkalicoccobacillus murimartini TaxID=171685 RepID=A0ABT9YQ65_9BACI|nr:TatD family hydrolase [Alkalicoccobacillus murimartini]MDQ0209174.1 TatD DNase family protein [Alkalicoccobacillus murimartini]